MADPDTMGELAAQDQLPDASVDWSRFNQPFGQLTDTNPVTHQTPYGSIRQGDINQAIGIGMGFSGGGLATRIAKAPAAPAIVKAPAPEAVNAPYITDPIRVANPKIYQRPDVIAAEAAANVAPEHPALKQLFGVTRQDLYDISQQGRRQGNIEPNLWEPKRAQPINEASAAVMNPANAQRIVDTLAEAQKYPDLVKGMVPWYVMDPAYQQMAKLVGPERAAQEYTKFNMSMTPFSAGSNVMTEINRGTAANMMRVRGEYPTFQQYAGVAAKDRGPDFPPELRDVLGHMMHRNQTEPVARAIATGQHGYDPNTVKIPLYTMASGVPETGFQTSRAVPDAHFTRALGVPDARRMATFNDYMSGPEYRPIGPWYHENVAKPLGIESVPAQALQWGVYAPQTGVRTSVGAGKLELLSQRIWERAQKLGVDPKMLRDQVLQGQQHSELQDGMGGLADQSRYG